MERLRAYGCKFALDDFGTGFASFGHLKNLPVDIVKIDGSFIVGIEHDPVDLAMVRSISDVAGLTGMKTVAEYVESDGILERLRELGIDYAQGFAVHRPEPLLVTR